MKLPLLSLCQRTARRTFTTESLLQSRYSARPLVVAGNSSQSFFNVTSTSPFAIRLFSATSNDSTKSTDTFASHDDFAPKRKAVVSDVDEAVKMIQQHVQDNRIMLYMKGNPSSPMCGFSAQVVQILQAEGVDFASVNVLDYPAIREGVKKFSDWPTVPQLYVDGEFIGGCDIVRSMHESGELAALLKAKAEQ